MIILNNVTFVFAPLFSMKKRFCLQIKPGGLIRVHTSVLQPTSLYKSLFISEETTSDELLTLLLSCYNSVEPVEQFSLYEVCVRVNYTVYIVCMPMKLCVCAQVLFTFFFLFLSEAHTLSVFD